MSKRFYRNGLAESLAGRPQARRQFMLTSSAALLALLAPWRISIRAASTDHALLLSLRIWPGGDYTRVTLESSASLRYKTFHLTQPDRLVLDIAQMTLDSVVRGLSAKVAPDDPYLKLLRAAAYKPGVVRIVFEAKTAVKAQVFTLTPSGPYGHRLVVDLYPQYPADPLLALLEDKQRDQQTTAEPAPSPGITEDFQPSEKSTTLQKERAARVRPMITIMIDPGHGGEDPGAIGRRGTHEKTVVLAIGRRLRQLINAESNLQAAMTRDEDFFVPLAERVKKARKIRADLLVSIHADAFLTPTARGSSVFALSLHGATSAAAKWLANKENDADIIGGAQLNVRDPYLKHTLLDLTQTATISDSLKLGKSVLNQLSLMNPLHKLAVEQAGFAVLKAPDIPSILIETAFISNPEEEVRLVDPHYQERLARAILEGLRIYLAQSPAAKHQPTGMIKSDQQKKG